MQRPTIYSLFVGTATRVLLVQGAEAHQLSQIPRDKQTRRLRVLQLGQSLGDRGAGGLCLSGVLALAAGLENLIADGGVNLGDLRTTAG